MNIVLLIAQIIVGLLFTLAGVLHGTRPIDKLAQQSPWAASIPLPLVRFIGLAEALGGLGVLVALVVVQNCLAILAASGLALIMLLAALFHATRREYREVGITLALGALPAFVAFGRAFLVQA
jgi:putative oxidoreductase